MVAKVYTGTTNGIEGILVCVEADISDGLPMFDMVGYLGAVRLMPLLQHDIIFL